MLHAPDYSNMTLQQIEKKTADSKAKDDAVTKSMQLVNNDNLIAFLFCTSAVMLGIKYFTYFRKQYEKMRKDQKGITLIYQKFIHPFQSFCILVICKSI